MRRESWIALPQRAREFHGEATEVAAASAEKCFALVATVDRYPDWCPQILREVEVLDRGDGGQPSRMRVRMRVARGAISSGFELCLRSPLSRPKP